MYRTDCVSIENHERTRKYDTYFKNLSRSRLNRMSNGQKMNAKMTSPVMRGRYPNASTSNLSPLVHMRYNVQDDKQKVP